MSTTLKNSNNASGLDQNANEPYSKTKSWTNIVDKFSPIPKEKNIFPNPWVHFLLLKEKKMILQKHPHS